jgi:hypothetical protein
LGGFWAGLFGGIRFLLITSIRRSFGADNSITLLTLLLFNCHLERKEMESILKTATNGGDATAKIIPLPEEGLQNASPTPLTHFVSPLTQLPMLPQSTSDIPPEISDFVNSISFPPELEAKRVAIERIPLGYVIAKDVSVKLFDEFMELKKFRVATSRYISLFGNEFIISGELIASHSNIRAAAEGYFIRVLCLWKDHLMTNYDDAEAIFCSCNTPSFVGRDTRVGANVKYLIGDNTKASIEACYSADLQEGHTKVALALEQDTDVDIGIVIKIGHPHKKIPTGDYYDSEGGLYVLLYYERVPNETATIPRRVISCGKERLQEQEQNIIRATTDFTGTFEGFTSDPVSRPVTDATMADDPQYIISLPPRALMFVKGEENSITGVALENIQPTDIPQIRLFDLCKDIKFGIKMDNKVFLNGNAKINLRDPNPANLLS